MMILPTAVLFLVLLIASGDGSNNIFRNISKGLSPNLLRKSSQRGNNNGSGGSNTPQQPRITQTSSLPEMPMASASTSSSDSDDPGTQQRTSGSTIPASPKRSSGGSTKEPTYIRGFFMGGQAERKIVQDFRDERNRLKPVNEAMWQIGEPVEMSMSESEGQQPLKKRIKNDPQTMLGGEDDAQSSLDSSEEVLLMERFRFLQAGPPATTLSPVERVALEKSGSRNKQQPVAIERRPSTPKKKRGSPRSKVGMKKSEERPILNIPTGSTVSFEHFGHRSPRSPKSSPKSSPKAVMAESLEGSQVQVILSPEMRAAVQTVAEDPNSYQYNVRGARQLKVVLVFDSQDKWRAFLAE